MPLVAAAYVPFWQAIDDFQALIAGILAIAAAGIAALAVLRAARLPIEAEAKRAEELRNRQLAFTQAALSSEWQTLLRRTRLVDDTITVTVAANAAITDSTRAKCYLTRPRIIYDWTFMSLLPGPLFSRITQLYALVDDHNFDIDRAGGAFGDQNFQRSLHTRLETIRSQTMALRSDIARTSAALRKGLF